MKKSQAAMEFLFTHGWMIILILVVIATVGYLAYLNSAAFIPDTCTLASGLKCTNFKVTTGAATVELQNSIGEDVTIDTLTIESPDGTECTVPVTNTQLGDNEAKQFDISGCNNGNINSKFSGVIKIQYSTGSNTFTQRGQIITKVEETSTTSTISTTSTSTSTSISTTSTTSTSTSTSTTTTIMPLTIELIPTAAIDDFAIDQVTPDDGVNDGTVDLSNNDQRWLTPNGSYIEVTAWNTSIPGAATVNAVKMFCEVDWTNGNPGKIEFSYNAGSGWSNWLCTQTVQVDAFTAYACDLYANGVDTPIEVNNLDVRCRFVKTNVGGNAGFTVDFINMTVSYI